MKEVASQKNEMEEFEIGSKWIKTHNKVMVTFQKRLKIKIFKTKLEKEPHIKDECGNASSAKKISFS